MADIQRRLDTGKITYAEAKLEATPLLDKINKRAEEVAKRARANGYKSAKAVKLDFANAMRNSY